MYNGSKGIIRPHHRSSAEILRIAIIGVDVKYVKNINVKDVFRKQIIHWIQVIYVLW